MISAMLAIDTTLVSRSSLHLRHCNVHRMLMIIFSVDSMDLRNLYVPFFRRLLPRNPAGVVDVCFRDHAPSHAQ